MRWGVTNNLVFVLKEADGLYAIANDCKQRSSSHAKVLLYLSALPARRSPNWLSSMAKGRFPKNTWYPEGEKAPSSTGVSTSLILIMLLVMNLLEGMLNATTFTSKAKIGKTMADALVISSKKVSVYHGLSRNNSATTTWSIQLLEWTNTWYMPSSCKWVSLQWSYWSYHLKPCHLLFMFHVSSPEEFWHHKLLCCLVVQRKFHF